VDYAVVGEGDVALPELLAALATGADPAAVAGVVCRTADGVSTVTDLGSTNGTKVNGRDVQSAPLSDGDRITVGATQIEYRST